MIYFPEDTISIIPNMQNVKVILIIGIVTLKFTFQYIINFVIK